MSNIVRSQSTRTDVLSHVSDNLKRLRHLAGLSQAALAAASGVSRRMIVNLEGGDTNVSLSSLDKLAWALGVDFVAMVADPQANPERIEALTWRGGDDASKAVLLGSVPAAASAQLWSWSLGVGGRYFAEPDPAGWHEMIFVSAGRLRIDKADGAVTIDAHDFAIYSSAQAFSYTNIGDETAKFTRVVVC
ncbi:helix-turn-helix domain-containing protein [Novosphingobium gossypii]|uniref:helix-turn-helix domain-containing protein n=1 Tax=Novosphingobium gossypii TaxID=1604774 RepID=UPI003D24D0DB